MFSRQCDRIAKAERERVIEPNITGLAFRLVGTKDHRGAVAAQQVCKMFIERHQACACINKEQACIRFPDCFFCLSAHTPFEARCLCFFQAGSINDPESQIAQARITGPTVTGHTWGIIDKREALAHKAIEERRLANIRSANNGDCRSHANTPRLVYSTWSMALSDTMLQAFVLNRTHIRKPGSTPQLRRHVLIQRCNRSVTGEDDHTSTSNNW